MLRYILKRLVYMIPVLLGITFIVFAIMNLTPGDPARLILGETASTEEVEALREELGLNDNFFVRYFRYIKDIVLHRDFGKSYRTRNPVYDELFARFPSTLKLAFGGVFLMTIIGVPIGVLSAVKQYSMTDRLITAIAFLLASVPPFWFGLMLILLFSIKLDLLPATGVDSWQSFILPSITLCACMVASLIRMTRSSMLEVLREDYIRTVKAKGAEERVVIFRHALKNALLPVITIVGLEFGKMLGGTMIIESVFAMPGLGTMTINAIRMKDTPLVIASILFVAVSISIMNLVVDLLYAFIDPRIKSQYQKVK